MHIIAVVLPLLILVLLFSISTFDKDKDGKYPTYIFGIVMTLCIAALLIKYINDETETAYRKGQIDALNGEFKYEKYYVFPENSTTLYDSIYRELEE